MANMLETSGASYSSAQRAVSLSLGVACGLPLTSSIALANAPMPVMPHVSQAGGWHEFSTFSPAPSHFSTSSQSSSSNGHLHNSVASLFRGNTAGINKALSTLVNGVSLNLASSSLSFLAGNLGNFSNLTIDVGGHYESVNLNTKLTGAEVVAVEQVLSGAKQSLAIGTNGAATGGSVSLTSNFLNSLDKSLGGSVASLTVARGVSLVDSVGSVDFSGKLVNYGSILTASGVSGVTDTIAAGTIYNASGATIASYTSGSAGSGLVGADVALSAASSLTNVGSITSVHDLSITAPVIINTGTIAAGAGNLNVSSPSALNISGAGAWQATNGNINIASGNSDINVFGANLASQQVNFNAGSGNIVAQLGNVSGVVNATGSDVHVGASTANLDLGNIEGTSDPTITNTGNLVITGGLGVSNGAALTLIAGGDIVSDTGNSISTTPTAAGSGGDLTLIAGATFTPFTSGTQAATITKGSATGGIIDLTGNNGGTGPVTSISADSNGAGAGGNITMVAFAGSAKGSGAVIVPTDVAITSTGTTTNGNVTIIAGAKSGAAVTTGAITGGTVTVDAAVPVIPKGGVTYDATGALTSGPITASATGNAGSITLGSVSTQGAEVLNINTGGNASVTNTGATPLQLGVVTFGKKDFFDATVGTGGVNVTGTITGGTLNVVNTGAGVDTLMTNVSSLGLNTGGNVTDTQGITTLGVSGYVGANAQLVLTSSGQVNITGPLSANGGAIDIATTSTDKGGINVGSTVLVGTTGSVFLNNQGKGLLTETKGVILGAGAITLVSTTNVGSKAAPFTTDALTSLTIDDTGAKSIVYVSDTNSAALAVNANLSTTAGGSLYLTSNSSSLNLGSANYNTVSITDNALNGGGVTLGKGPMGTGVGTFSVVSASGILQAVGGGAILGTTVTLTSTGLGASIGTLARVIDVTSPNLALNSSQGNVYVSDSVAATVNGAAGLGSTFFVTDTGTPTVKTGDSLTVSKSVGGGNITLTTSGAAGNIAINGTVGTSTTAFSIMNSAAAVITKGKIYGQTVGLTGLTITVGGTVGSSTSNVFLDNTSTAGLIISSVVTGSNISITSGGTITTKAAINGTGANSSVNLFGTSTTPTGNAIVVGSAVTGSVINLSLGTNGQGNIAVNSAVGNTATSVVNIGASAAGTGVGGSLTGTGLITGTLVNLNAADSIGTSVKPMNTAAGTLSASAAGTGTGQGAFVTQKGNLSLGTSTDSNLVVKATGALTVSGTVTSPNLSLTSSGATTIDGLVENSSGTAPTTGTMTITSGTTFNISPGGEIKTTTGSNPITVNSTGAATINGTVMAATFDLNTKSSLTVGPSGVLNDGADKITAVGNVVVNGTVGEAVLPANFTITTPAAFVFGPGITINGGGSVTAGSITNYANLVGVGNLRLVGTGTGNAFANYGTIESLNVTMTTSNPTGIIYNAPGATIEATQVALQNGAPTVNLDTYNVNNQGTIQAISQVQQFQGTLNITSPGALTIAGPTGSFGMNYFGAVNLKAGGNITVGGLVAGVVTNPFSNFNAANELGTFTVNTTGIFTSPLSGIGVLTNTTGSFGGNISITASNVGYNGIGTAPQFILSAVGAGPTISSGKDPIILNLTGSQGISVGANGKFGIQVEGFGNTSLTTLNTPGPLLINTTDPSTFNVNYTSLALTGNSRVLITGNLDEGALPTTTISITTLSGSPFLIGGAVANTGNGQTGITTGQGISAGVLAINVPGAVTLGTSTTGLEAVLNGTASVTMDTTALTVNYHSDITGLALNLNYPTTAAAGNFTYTNLNVSAGGLGGYISASALNITDTVGNVVLSSGASSAPTSISVGTNPQGPNYSGYLRAGGEININAQNMSFSPVGILFSATGGIDGGQVILNFTGSTTGTTSTTYTVDLPKSQGGQSGAIYADVHGTAADYAPAGVPTFKLTNAGNIVVNNLNAANPANSSIYLGQGAVGGVLSFVADGAGTKGAGSTVLVQGANLSGLVTNLFNISSNSTTPLMLQGATTNGIVNNAKTNPITLYGGDLAFSNQGSVTTNGINLSGVNINLNSNTSIIATGNSSFTAAPSPAENGTNGGQITISAPAITVATSGLALVAQGGTLSGGSINVSTTMTPIVVAQTQQNGGTTANAISFDVGNLSANLAGQNVAGTVSITSPGNIVANGNGIVFADPGNAPGVGGNLIFNPGTTGNISLTNAAGIVGLNFSTVTFNSTSTGAFNLGNASSGGNGIIGASSLIAGAVIVNAPSGSINAANELIQTHALTLNSPTISFLHGQTLAVLPDGAFVGVTGYGANGDGTGITTQPTGNGGSINLTFTNFGLSGTGTAGVGLSAVGAGAAALSPGSTGGAITINDNSTSTFSINSKTFSSFDVSNANGGTASPAGNLQTAGSVTISNVGNINLMASSADAPLSTGSTFVYGSTGGSLSVTAPNILVTNVTALSEASQQSTASPLPTPGYGLASISFTTNSATAFSVGGASNTSTGNGFVDANPTLVATNITIANNYTIATKGGINLAEAAGVEANNLTYTTPGVITLASGETITALPSVVPVTITNPAPQPPTIIPSGTGGSITISTSGLTITGTAGPVLFKAQGNTPYSVPGAGGTIKITDTGTSTINIGLVTGDLEFNVGNIGTQVPPPPPVVPLPAGLVAGSVTVINGGNINVNGAAFTFGPFQPSGSGTLSLTGANILFSNVAAISNQDGGGIGGISLTTASNNDFVFGGATLNGFSDTGAATLVVGALTVNTNAGGTLTGGINTAGTGSSVTTVNAFALDLNTVNTVTLISNTGLSVHTSPLTGAGGSIAITTGNIAFTTPGVGATLYANGDASGSASGGGGTITLVDTDKTNAVLNLSSSGLSFDVSNVNVGATAGTVSVTSAGVISANGNAFNFGGPQPTTGNAGSGTLALAGSNLLVSNTAALNTSAGGPLQSVTFTTTSNSNFTFGQGAGTVNGLVTTGDVLAAATVVINANATGTLSGGLDATGMTNGTSFTIAASNLTLDTLNTLTLASGGSFTTVPELPSGNGGSITLTAGAIGYSGAGTGDVALKANASGSGAGGTITITDAGTAGLKIDTSGLVLSVSNSGGGNGGTISVTNGGAISANGASINVGSGFPVGNGASLTLNANGVLAYQNAGLVDPTNMLKLVLSSDSQQAFLLGGASAGTNGITDNNLSLEAATLTIANQGGAILEGSAAGLNSSTAMTLSASTNVGGGSGAPIVLNGAIANLLVTVNAGGSATLNVTDTAATTISSTNVIGALLITVNGTGGTSGNLLVGSNGTGITVVQAQSVKIDYNNASSSTLYLGGITAFDGSLIVASAAQNMEILAGNTQVTPTTPPVTEIITPNIDAYNGNITLQNLSTAGGANIKFDGGIVVPVSGSAPNIIPGAQLRATGPTPLLSEGNVTIVMGSTNFTPVAGNAPSGVNVISNDGGAVTFGAQTTNPGGSITYQGTNAGSSSLLGLGRNLIFNTGTFAASAIIIGDFVTITADPPGSAVVPVQANTGAMGSASALASVYSAAAISAITNAPLTSTSFGVSSVSNSAAALNTALTSGASSATQSASVVSAIGLPPAASSALSVSAINNASITTMTLGQGADGALLNSALGGASAESLSGGISDNAVTVTGASSRLAAVSGQSRKLTGGVSNIDHRTLEKGPILLSPLKDQVVETPFGTVSVAAHSVVLIISTDDGVAVYNLHDTHKNAVVINSGSINVAITPGRSAMLTNSGKGFAQINPAPFVSYRRLVSQGGGADVKIHQADFDITSIIRGLPAVKHLLQSEDAGARKAMTSMLKTAAIMSQLGVSNEPFSLYLPPALTAYAESVHH